MPLSRPQISFLRTIAHGLKPIIQVGNKGVTPTLIEELSNALDHHELVKVKVSAEDRESRDAAIAELVKAVKGENVQKIGNIVCIYRLNKAEPKIELPRASK